MSVVLSLFISIKQVGSRILIFLGLERALLDELHGQHIAAERVYHHLVDHISGGPPQKPLALSFHGYTGVGKNFASNIIVNNILKLGTRSRFYHFYDATIHFKHTSHISEYKERLYKDLHKAVSQCPTSIFVFDEMHNMPQGILDILSPLLDVRESVEGVDFRRAIFIFLSNAGGNYINRRTYEHLISGKKREDLRYTDVDRILTKSAFNNEGGLQFSELITKHLITAVIPFLPLQPTHVRKCIQDVAKRRNVTFSEDMVQFVLDELEWSPEGSKFFSVSGCKRVYEKVGFYLQQL
ncbi:Torsin-1B [Schistosoma japonicum]|nr:Torsin-1B [Schistosoma japonicum]